MMFSTVNRLIAALISIDTFFNTYWIILYDKPALLKDGLPVVSTNVAEGSRNMFPGREDYVTPDMVSITGVWWQ